MPSSKRKRYIYGYITSKKNTCCFFIAKPTNMLRSIFFFLLITSCTAAAAKETNRMSDTTKPLLFSEGIMHTRISFPSNPLNELLSSVDFTKGDVQSQLRNLQNAQQNEAYARKVKAQVDKMAATEKQAMTQMMMAALMSPLYTTIYFDKEKALAKAYALNYRLESFMNVQEGKGKMVAITNDNSNSAAITFSASNLQKAWQKESADAEHYNIQWLNVVEKVGGIPCNKVVYTRKAGKNSSGQLLAYKLIAWYSPQLSNRINFAHPFYLDIPHGILKIEIHYDVSGKNRMVYEVASIDQKKLSAQDFILTDIQPVLDWDANQVQASMNMLNVFMSQGGSQ